MANKCPTCHADNPETVKFCGECGTKLDSSTPGHPSGAGDRGSFTKTLGATTEELARGTLFAGRYEVIEELGTGGMGRVYRVHDTKLNEEVALKLIRPEVGTDKRTVERFHNEIKIARKINHKNVCRTYDLHEEGKTLYLTMEYVRGEDLKGLIKRTKVLAVGTSVSIARQTAEGLAEAHKLGVVHRDLKPGNIMIDKEGQAKIMDFGIARAMREKGITGAGAIVGTPEYMSPEQVDGKEADQRADIYALGIILFEMVTGQVPFEGETPFSIANKHKSEPPPIPKKLVPQIPEALSKLVLRCLEKDRAKRYQSAEELILDLSAIEGALPGTERATGRLPSRTRSRISRGLTVTLRPNKIVIAAGAVLILAAAGFLLWRNVIHPPTPPLPSAKPTLAVLSFRNNSGNPSLDVWKENLPTLLAGGLGQSRYFRLLDDPTVYGILKKLNLQSTEKYTAEELRAIAAEGGATHLLSGNYLEAGGKFIINVSLINGQTGTVLAPIEEDAPNQGAIVNSIDGLVKKIKSALHIPEQAVADDVYTMVGEVYTKNLQALQDYFEAVAFERNGQRDKAIASYERAIDLDPEFGMAYVKLSPLYQGLGDYFKKDQCLTKAFQLRDKLPEKDRLLVEGNLYMLREKTIPKAVDILRTAAERYPDDFQAGIDFAYALDWVDLNLRIREYERIISRQNQPRFYAQVARLLSQVGDYSQARERYETWLKTNLHDAGGKVQLGWYLMLERKFEAALGEFEKAVALAPDDLSIKSNIADYYILKGELKKSRGMLEGLRKTSRDPTSLDEDFNSLDLIEGKFNEVHNRIEEREKKEKGSWSLSFEGTIGALLYRGALYLQSGRPARALEEFRNALEIVKREEDRVRDTGYTILAHHRRTCMLWQICAYCDMGNISEAEVLGSEFERLVPDHQKKLKIKCLCYNSELVEGKIALAKKNLPEGIRKLEIGWQQLPREDSFFYSIEQAYILDSLADGYCLSARLDKAAETYGQIQELVTGRWNWGAVYARSFYKLGKVYEQLGKKDEARKEFTKFLDLCKDADPGLPEVPDAKRRLAALGT